MRRNRHIIGFAVRVERRICLLQHTTKVDTQKLRKKWMDELDDLFSLAASIAKGDVSQEKVGDKLETISPKDRQMWAQIAAKIGGVMANLSRGFDEREFNEDLQELERLVDDIEKLSEQSAAKEMPALYTNARSIECNNES